MLTRGDDSDAFGQEEFLRINYNVPAGQVVSRAILVCGALKLTFNNPSNPIEVNLTSEQTAILKDNNCCNIVLYDALNKQITIPCIAEFKTREGVL